MDVDVDELRVDADVDHGDWVTPAVASPVASSSAKAVTVSRWAFRSPLTIQSRLPRLTRGCETSPATRGMPTIRASAATAAP
jgi:hypothetical protein